MKYFVTGASGRVGSRVAEELIKKGNEVVGYDMSPARVTMDGYTHEQGDFLDADRILSAMKDCDAVLHLGAYMSWFPDEERLVYDSIVTGTFNVLKAVEANGIKRFLLASTGEVYPEVNAAYLPVDEKHPRNPTSIYGLCKAAAEDLTWFFSRRSGINSTVIRVPHTQSVEELMDENSYFSGPRFFLRGKLRQQKRAGNKAAVEILEGYDTGAEQLYISCGSDGTPYTMMICDVRDLVDGLLLAIDQPKTYGETIAINPDDKAPLEDVINMMAEETGLPVCRVSLPGKAIVYYSSNQKAKELMGFSPKHSLRDMVKEAAAHWRERHER